MVCSSKQQQQIHSFYSSPCGCCRPEQQSGRRHAYSARESGEVISQPAPSEPRLCAEHCQDQDKQDAAAEQHIQARVEHSSTDNKDTLSKGVNVYAAPEFSVCTGNANADTSSGKCNSSARPHPGPSREQRETEEGSTVLRNQRPQKTSAEELSSDEGSAGRFGEWRPFGELPAQPSQSLLLLTASGSSHVSCLTETPAHRSLRENEPSPSNPTQLQSEDHLPTFTSQRPLELLTTLGERASSDPPNVNSMAEGDHRCVWS